MDAAEPTAAEPTIERFGYRQQLSRTLSFTDLMFYGLVFMVPIAPFGIFGQVFQASGGMVALAYLIGMVAMAFTALSYAEMARAFPMTGSVYTYAGRGIHPAAGFLAGWVILLDYILVPSLLYLVAAAAMSAFVPAVPIWAWLIGFVLLNTVVNYLGIKLTAQVVKVFLIGELVVLAIFLVVGIAAIAGGAGGGFSFAPLYDAGAFAWPVVLGATSVAVLSFLGFDAISLLAEENREESRQIGRATVAALGLAGVLFIVQTWVAALLVEDPAALIAEGDPAGSAFYDLAGAAGGAWLGVLTALTTAIAWGFADSLVAQTATARLVFAMARDRRLPAALGKVQSRHRTPANATLAVGVIALLTGFYMSTRDDGIALLSSLVNFGAMAAFVALHVSVVAYFLVRRRSGDWVRHLLVPVAGAAVLLFVLFNANSIARDLGLIWLGAGLVVLMGTYLLGKRPSLSGIDESEAGGESEVSG